MNPIQTNSSLYRIPNSCIAEIFAKYLEPTIENIKSIFSISKQLRSILFDQQQLAHFDFLIIKNSRNNSLQIFQKFTYLTSLDVSGNQQINNVGFIHLTHLTALRNLNLARCQGFTDALIPQLPTTLRCLNLSRTKFSNTILQSLTIPLEEIILSSSQLVTSTNLTQLPTTLRRLNLSNCDVTNVSFQSLSRIPLQALELERCLNFTFEGLASLQHTLLYLNVRECYQIDDRALEVLPKTLQYLDVTMCFKITDAGLSFLTEMPLETLNLARCRLLTDSGFDVLPHTLLNLDITGCYNITDQGLLSLSEIPLKNLRLTQCRLITEAGIVLLRQNLLDLNLIR